MKLKDLLQIKYVDSNPNVNVEDEARRIMLINYIGLISMCNMLLYIVIYSLVSFTTFLWAIVFLSFCMVSVFPIILINKNGKHELAKYLISGFNSIFMFLVATVFFEQKMGFHTYLLLANFIPLIICNFIEENFEVYADKYMIFKVIRNLLSNAITFTPLGGKIELNAKITNMHIQVCVCDSGPGMDKQQIENIFNFTQQSGDDKNHGLGLLICKDFIEQNKGEIWVNNKDTGGCSFHFTIPTCQA